MAGPIRIAILANASQAKRELDSVGTAAQGMGSKMKNFGKMAGVAAVAGLAVAGAAAIKFAGDAVQAASTAEQSLGASQTVFGKWADEVIKTSNDAATKFGLSANEYRENANLIGSLLKNQGVSMKDLGKETENLVGQGADLAATFGGTTSDAVGALGAALKGEFEQMERYGVSVKAATVTQEAWAVAGVDSAKEFSELSDATQTASKKTAIFTLINDQAKDSVGAFGRESDTLAHKQQVLGAKFEDVKTKVGNLLLPIMADLADFAIDRLVPAFEDMVAWLQENQDEFAATAIAIKDRLLPPIQDLAAFVQDAVAWVSDLPGPIKKLGGEAALAALALPKLTAALNGVKGAAGNMVTNLSNAEGRLKTFKGVAAGAAGIGGLALLADSATQTKDNLKLLEQVGGGALMGFAVGGPIGAAVGGLAGLMLNLATNTENAASAAYDSVGEWGDLKGTLDGVTGSTTALTREFILNALAQDGVLADLNKLGVSSRTAVNAVLGHKNAQTQMNTAWDQAEGKIAANNVQIAKYDKRILALGKIASPDAANYDPDAQAKLNNILNRKDALEKENAELENVIQTTKAGTGVTRESIKEKRREIAATADYTGKLKGIPKRAKTEIKADGIIPTTKGIARLVEKYNLTPRQIKTLIKATGVDTTVKDVKKVADKIEDIKNAKPDLTKFRTGVQNELRDAKNTASKGIADMNRDVKTDTGKARANLAPFKSDVSRQLNGVKGTASAGGQSIGSALKFGLASGVAGAGGLLAGAVSSAVREGIAAGRREAAAASPSKKTEELGRDLMLGMARGIDKNKDKVTKPLADVTELVLAFFPQEMGTIETSVVSALDGILTQIDETYAKHAETVEKNIRDRFDRLRKAAKKGAKAAKPKEPKGDKSARLAEDATEKQKKAAAAAEEKRDKAAKARTERHNKAAQAAQDALDSKEKKRIRESGERHKARAEAVKASLAGINAALRANARAQDEVNAALEAAQGVLAERQQEMADYVASVKSQFVDLANVVGTGMRDILRTPEQVLAGVAGGQVASAESIIAELRVKVDQARRFADNIRLLTARGLNQTTLQQMLAAGPEAAGATAQAIADGGQAAVEEIDLLTSDLVAQGESLGTTMASTFYQAGVTSAQDLVNGLAAQQAAVVAEGVRLSNALSTALNQGLGLDQDPKDKNSRAHKTGRAIVDGVGAGIEANYDRLDHMGGRMADRLLRAVKDKLGIRSPSRVFKRIGAETTKGLVIGLDDARVRRAGEQMASAVISGFGGPGLSATAVLEAGGATGGVPVTITVNVPPTADKAAIGREVAKTLDAFYRQGGRRAS